jgi:FdhD protein
VIRGFPERLRDSQDIFDSTGGLHAAGLFDAAGNLLVLREGRRAPQRRRQGRRLGRAPRFPAARAISADGVGKSLVRDRAEGAGRAHPARRAVSAPTSLAVELAGACGITVVGFLRGESMNVYTNPARVHA